MTARIEPGRGVPVQKRRGSGYLMDFSQEGGRNRLWLGCRFTEYGDSGIRAKHRNGGITTDGTTPPEDQDGEDATC